MIDPLQALVVAALLIAAVVALAWPGTGLWWRWRRVLRITRRALLEDGLKHLYDCEYRGTRGNVNSTAGALGISGDRAADLLHLLQEETLAVSGPEGTRLTPEGRRYALRVIRTHRLWERYFADQTGLRAEEWHDEAEIREHTTSPADADALAASMGHPRYDPHGDPIPTPEGDMPPKQGKPVWSLSSSEVAEIVHVEDEPPALYAQLLAEGLHPGVRVRLLESTPQRILLEAGGEEHVLSPVVAANLSLRPLPGAELPEPTASLASLEPGDRARVRDLSPALRGAERRRLLDLGLVPGTELVAERQGPGGNLTAYRIRGALMAIRREQAELIGIEPLVEENAA